MPGRSGSTRTPEGHQLTRGESRPNSPDLNSLGVARALQGLATTEARLERLAFLESKSAELVDELQMRTLERDDAVIDRQRILEQLGHAHATIRAMESSLFWRLRKPWAAFSRLIRRG